MLKYQCKIRPLTDWLHRFASYSEVLLFGADSVTGTTLRLEFPSGEIVTSIHFLKMHFSV